MKVSENNMLKFIKERGLNLIKYVPSNSSKYNITLLCDCGDVYTIPYHGIMRKDIIKCKKCTSQYRKTNRLLIEFEKFRKIIADKCRCEIMFDKFMGWDISHNFKCECGREFKAKPTSFVNNSDRVCNRCISLKINDNTRHSLEYVKNYIKNNTKFKLVSDTYINSSSKLILECECGDTYNASFNYLKKSGRALCSSCTSKNRVAHNKFDYKFVKDWISENTNSELISTTYINGISEIKLKCYCGDFYNSTFSNIRAGKSKSCPKCSTKKVAKQQAHSYDYIKKYIENDTGLKLVSESYVNRNSKLELKCVCGNTFFRTFDVLSREDLNLCRACANSSSKSERTTYGILKKYNIEFKTEKTFENCLYIKKLRFDFYISSINTCLELDGEAHYQAIKKFGGDSTLKSTQIKDNIKNKFCQENNINLIRIPYWDFDKIEEILKEYDII